MPERMSMLRTKYTFPTRAPLLYTISHSQSHTQRRQRNPNFQFPPPYQSRV